MVKVYKYDMNSLFESMAFGRNCQDALEDYCVSPLISSWGINYCYNWKMLTKCDSWNMRSFVSKFVPRCTWNQFKTCDPNSVVET